MCSHTGGRARAGGAPPLQGQGERFGPCRPGRDAGPPKRRRGGRRRLLPQSPAGAPFLTVYLVQQVKRAPSSPPPSLFAALRPYQSDAVRWMSRRDAKRSAMAAC
mmetsp:Transcript_44891/g.87905  ORF Transcript_44891/g.87905 Transcript_44891/m.87905 type:complete len:105 (+) Transcript_44891:302-616(+)